MKKVILLIALTLGALQANDIVHYDTNNDSGTQISRPNYPSQDIYPTK